MASAENDPVPDPSKVSHQELSQIMIHDAQRQEPLVSVIASMLEETVLRNDEHNKNSNLASFTGRKPPLSPCAFVTRIGKYSGASPCCFAVGLIYLERMKKRDPGVCLVSTNFQRLFLTAVMVAAKFLDDFYYSNKHWAEVGGVTTQEINRLEIEFLFRMGFSLHMQREEYDWYAEELHSKVEQEAAKLAKLTTQSANVNAPSATGPIDVDHPRIPDLQNLSTGTYAAVQRTMSKNAPDSDTLSTMTTPSSSHQHSPTRPGSVAAASQRVVQRVSPPMMQGGLQLAHAVGTQGGMQLAHAVGTHIQGVQNVQTQGAATHVYPAGGQLQGAAGRTPGSGEGVKGPGNSMDWVFC